VNGVNYEATPAYEVPPTEDHQGKVRIKGASKSGGVFLQRYRDLKLKATNGVVAWGKSQDVIILEKLSLPCDGVIELQNYLPAGESLSLDIQARAVGIEAIGHGGELNEWAAICRVLSGSPPLEQSVSSDHQPFSQEEVFLQIKPFTNLDMDSFCKVKVPDMGGMYVSPPRRGGLCIPIYLISTIAYHFIPLNDLVLIAELIFDTENVVNSKT
jgi:hypothetical protein